MTIDIAGEAATTRSANVASSRSVDNARLLSER